MTLARTAWSGRIRSRRCSALVRSSLLGTVATTERPQGTAWKARRHPDAPPTSTGLVAPAQALRGRVVFYWGRAVYERARGWRSRRQGLLSSVLVLSNQ